MKKIATQFLFFGLSIIAAMGIVLAWMWKRLPPKLPWFYSLPWGEAQLVNKMVVVYILCGSVVLLLITRFFSTWARKDDDTVEIVVMAGGLTAVILLGATFFRVMQIFIGT